MFEIQNLIFKFANSFDLKEWDVMKTLFLETVVCDYTSLRKTHEILMAEEYVNKRREALDSLKTQHLFSNLEVTVSGSEALCRCSALIMRKLHEDFFNTHAVYEFTLFYKNNTWLIGKIKQVVLWNEGNSKMHIGVNQGT